MAGRFPVNMNIAFHNCQYNPYILGYAIDTPAFTNKCCYPSIPEAPSKIKEYSIRFDNALLAYLVDIFIGNENQMVSVIIDTNMIDILFPTNCCVGSEAGACLQNYGIYFSINPLPALFKNQIKLWLTVINLIVIQYDIPKR